MVKEHLVRTAESHVREKENLALCMKLAGVKIEGQLSRHKIMGLVRVLHESVNELVLELFRVAPNHIIFKDLPPYTHIQLCEAVVKTSLPEDTVNSAPDNGWVGRQLPHPLTF